MDTTLEIPRRLTAVYRPSSRGPAWLGRIEEIDACCAVGATIAEARSNLREELRRAGVEPAVVEIEDRVKTEPLSWWPE